jgi:predicted nucleic acid-binding protein
MRRSQSDVAGALSQALDRGAVVMTPAIELELLRTSRDARDHRELAREYGALPRIPLDGSVEARALEVQAALALRGYHRGPSPVDLLAAAAAEHAEAELWHCDRHFELIADVTGQPIRKVGR